VFFAHRIRSSTSGVRAVTGVERWELSDAAVGVGGKRGVAPPVAFLERIELRTGVWVFAPDDDSGPVRVACQCGGGAGYR